VTEDELTALLLAKAHGKFRADPAIFRIAARHILAFMADLTDEQEEVVMFSLGRLIAEIESVETARMAQVAQRMYYPPKPAPKKKAFDKFISAITLDWLV